MDIRVRQQAFQVAKEPLCKDRVPGAPQQQRRNASEVGEPERDAIECSTAGMARLEWDVGHEFSDGLPPRTGGVRGT